MASAPAFEDGDLLEVRSFHGEKLGLAIVSKGESIVGHMMAFGDTSLEQALGMRIQEAIALRRRLFDPIQTNAIRLINAEGDGIPGLIVDSYAGVLVLQIAHSGIERLKNQIVNHLIRECAPLAIYEKSTSHLRANKGLSEVRALLYGSPCPQVEALENGLRYCVDILEGQKTGLFLDQREMRALVRSVSRNKRVLNCFAYTGGFSVAALSGGAVHVDSVEISAKCAPCIEKNLELNGLKNHTFFHADVADFLKSTSWDYDLIILDPPAFAKRSKDVDQAFRAYKDLNSHVMRKAKPASLILSSSCSSHIDEALFQNILFRAACEANRTVRILEKHRQAHDHPISIFHPESGYLKSFLLAID